MSSSHSPEGGNVSRYASVLRPGLFAGEVHWVTGGGSGIGRCVAHELAALGATVILTGRGADKLQQVADEITQDGGKAEIAAFDIRDEEALRAAVSDAVRRHGRIHGLVNNAGGQFPSPLATINKKGFETVLASNLDKKVGDTLEVYDGELFEIVGIFDSFSVLESGAMVMPMHETFFRKIQPS